MAEPQQPRLKTHKHEGEVIEKNKIMQTSRRKKTKSEHQENILAYASLMPKTRRLNEKLAHPL